MITFDMPPTLDNTHLVSSDFNRFLDSTANYHFGARLAGKAIASVLVSNGAPVEDLDLFAEAFISEHEGTETFTSPMSQWPALAESFQAGVAEEVSQRTQGQKVSKA